MHKAAKHVRAGQSATTQASRVGESQHIVEHLLQLAVFSKPTKKAKSAQRKYLQPLLTTRSSLRGCDKQLTGMREGFAFVYFQSLNDTTLLFFSRADLYDACMRRLLTGA